MTSDLAITTPLEGFASRRESTPPLPTEDREAQLLWNLFGVLRSQPGTWRRRRW